jgi:SAM-dependent methyltransferase
MMSSYYGRSWDMYVTKVFEHAKTPESVFAGDEWGNPVWWDICYKRLLERAGANDWKRAVEIGPGSGKYTNLLLERSKCDVLAFDVSQEFMRVMEERLANYRETGRLTTALLEAKGADEMLNRIEKEGWRGTLDGFFSMDAMVHVDLQFLTAYFVTAAICLRPGGKLVMTLADGTSPRGVKKLLDDIKNYYPLQGELSLKFEFLSPEIVRKVLGEIGFTIDLLEHDSLDATQARDIFLIATKGDADVTRLESFLRW